LGEGLPRPESTYNERWEQKEAHDVEVEVNKREEGPWPKIKTMENNERLRQGRE